MKIKNNQKNLTKKKLKVKKNYRSSKTNYKIIKNSLKIIKKSKNKNNHQ